MVWRNYSIYNALEFKWQHNYSSVIHNKKKIWIIHMVCNWNNKREYS